MKFLGSIFLCFLVMLGIVFAQQAGRQGTEIRVGGGGGSATNAQPPSAALSNAANNPNLVTNILGSGNVTVTSNNLGTFTISGGAALTDLPWNTNLLISYNYATAISNLPSFADVELSPGTNSVTPVIVTSNGFGGINMVRKTNITFRGDRTTISGRSAIGEILYLSNCVNITFKDITFDGLVVTNTATAPNNRQWGIISLAQCDNIVFENCRFLNGHSFGLLDLATANSGFAVLTTNVTVRNNYFYNCGSHFIGGGLEYDGSAIEGMGWVIENNLFEENLHAIELFDDTNGRLVEGTIIRNNRIRNTIRMGIWTAGTTNANGTLIENNFFENVQGYTRRGTNYWPDSAGMYIPGGQRTRIIGNTVIGTNSVGIQLGGGAARMDDVVLSYNTINGSLVGLLVGNNNVTYSYGMTAVGNNVVDANLPFSFGGLRNSTVTGNTVDNVRSSGQAGFNFFVSGVYCNTNVLVSGNTAADTTGNMDYGYSSSAGNSNIVFGINQSVGHTAGAIEGVVGINVVLRMHVGGLGFPEVSQTLVEKETMYVDYEENFNPITIGYYSDKFGFSNVNSGNMVFYMPSPGNDALATKSTLRVGSLSAGMTVGTDANTNLISIASAGGTNFDKALVGGIIYSITNAGNNTTVTADWNGPHWLRLQFNGATTISFTNCPAASPTNGQIYTLELYAPTTVPTVTIQNIDARAISWQGVGAPVLVDGITNFLTVRFDGTNFIGQSHQDRTIGTITSPYQLAYHSVSSNQNNKGVLSLTNQPGDGAPALRFRGTNGNAYTELSIANDQVVTNRIIINVTNVQAGEILEVLGVSHSGGITTIILTNGIDGGGAGSPGGTYNGQVQYNSNSTFQADGGFFYDAAADTLEVSNNTASVAGYIVRSSGTIGTRQYSGGIHSLSASAFNIGVGGGSNWQVHPASHFIPLIDDTSDIGEYPLNGTNKVRNVAFSRQLLPKQHRLHSDITLTNLIIAEGYFWAQETNIVANQEYHLITGLPGNFELHFIGRTNSAVNHTISFTNAEGAKLTWIGSSTNGNFTLTVFSNSFLKVIGSVTTNLTQTNYWLTWLSDSQWPQRNLAIIASAGSSTSNLTVGGLIYNDRQRYTNHSNAQNVTNYAFVMLPANILTNDGDMIIGEWDVRNQVTSDGTNQFFIGFGANTNIFNTGSFTNKADSNGKLRCEITRTGNSSQSVYCEYYVFGLNNIRFGISTNADITETCGITNILRMHGRKAGVNTPGNVGNHTNTQFRVWYQPISR